MVERGVPDDCFSRKNLQKLDFGVPETANPCYFHRNCVFRDVIVFRKLEKTSEKKKKREFDFPNQQKHCYFHRFGMFFVVRGVRETPKMTPSPRSPKIAFLGVLKWHVAHWIQKVFLRELIEFFWTHGTIKRTLPFIQQLITFLEIFIMYSKFSCRDRNHVKKTLGICFLVRMQKAVHRISKHQRPKPPTPTMKCGTESKMNSK